MKYKQLKEFLDSKCTCFHIGSYPHRYKAFNLNKNPELKQMLTEAGFFDFHLSNSGVTAYYHQIISFYFCGGIEALKRGLTCIKGVHELHHLNGITSDNRPSNLVYITEEGHNLVTKHQRAFNKYIRRIKKASLINYWTGTIWNKQGRVVKNFVDWLFNILVKTLCFVANNLNEKFLISLYNAISNKKDTSLVKLPFIIPTS
jgi:hypothetical protein